MRKYNKNHQEETQIIWRTTSPEKKFNPIKRYYGVIKQGERSLITEYETKLRSDAKNVFENEAKLIGGTLEYIGVFK